jgi:LytR cell envelope-related transcriptional attenuator
MADIDTAARIGAFVVLGGCIVLAVLQTRQRRRLRRLLRASSPAWDRFVVPPLHRVAELRARAAFSMLPSGVAASYGQTRRRVIAVTLVVLVLGGLGFGAWWLWGRGDAHAAPKPSAKAPAERATRAGLGPDPTLRVPARIPPLSTGAGAYTVGVLNASGVPGAARARTVPLVRSAGFVVGRVDNAPVSDLSRSVVMWRPGRRAVAWQVARRLRIPRVSPIDGVPDSLVGGADVVVIVGRDRAR